MIGLTTALLVSLVPSAAQRIEARVDAMVVAAIEAATQDDDLVTIEGTRLFVHKACHLTEASVAQRLEGSGRVGVRLVGTRAPTKTDRGEGLTKPRACSGFAWVQVVVKRRVLVTVDTIARGDPLAGHVRAALVEVKPGRRPLQHLVAGAVAAHKIDEGEALMPFMVRALEAKAGAPVPVHIVRGGIRLTVPGIAVRCGLQHACARLVATGKIVRGRAEDGAVVVEGGLP